MCMAQLFLVTVLVVLCTRCRGEASFSEKKHATFKVMVRATGTVTYMSSFIPSRNYVTTNVTVAETATRMSNLTPSDENKLTGCLALNGPIECFGPALAACTLLNPSVPAPDPRWPECAIDVTYGMNGS